MKTSEMPSIPVRYLGSLTEGEREVAELIFKISGDRAYLKASKPQSTKKEEGAGRLFKIRMGKAQYTWRMIAFMVSPDAKHHCMPVCADFDLPEHELKETKRYFDMTDEDKAICRAYKKAMQKECDALTDKIVDMVPKHEWHGVRRWGRALGY